MAKLSTLELINQNEGLIKLNPVENTLMIMNRASIEMMTKDKERKASDKAMEYICHFVASRNLGITCTVGEMKNFITNNLSDEDLNHMPEIIFADRKRKVWFFGWIPIIGWIYAYRYFLFEKRIKFLISLRGEQMFTMLDVRSACSNIAIRNSP